MKYELLKQLSEAGFPVNEHEGFQLEWGGRRVILGEDEGITYDMCTKICNPKLHELIEASGMEALIWSNTKLQWEAAKKNISTQEVTIGEGSTPEEAVANLWLLINPKS